MSDEQREEDLRALLATVDPAAALPAADPAGVARLMEDTMSHVPETPQTVETSSPAETRGDHLHHRSRLTWIVAAAAATIIVGGASFAVFGGDDDGPAAASGATDIVDGSGAAAPDSGETPSVTELSVLGGAAVSGKCLTPEAAPQVVSSQSLVVDATVESISGGVVTLAPTRFYAGEETDLVTVTEPGGDLQMLLSAVTFKEGGRYLVSATDGQVTLCGFSAPYSEQLAAVYDEAFAG